MTSVHFASAMPHSKCNNAPYYGDGVGMDSQTAKERKWKNLRGMTEMGLFRAERTVSVLSENNHSASTDAPGIERRRSAQEVIRRSTWVVRLSSAAT